MRIGDLVPLILVDGSAETSFTYVVPDANQCANCHATWHLPDLVPPTWKVTNH